MRVGVLRVDLHVPQAGSLKGKRQVLRSLKDRLFSRFNVSVAEVGSQDLWQRAQLGIAHVSLDAQGADSALRKVEEFIRQHPGCIVLGFEREVLEFDGETDWEHWSPPASD